MSSNQKLIHQTDQCVMCGLCLPHCPTYLISQNEGESPRGRISLIKAFAEGNLSASSSLENHLQSCTGCMKCQSVCPAKVPYQEIIDHGRELYRGQLRLSDRWLQTLSIRLLTHSWGHALLGLASHLKALAPSAVRTPLAHYRSSTLKHTETSPSKVILFPGCTGNPFDQETLTSIKSILDTLDIATQIPADVFCCGALAQHSGQPKKAQQQLSQFSDYLRQENSHECISFASGCGQQLALFASKYNYRHFDIHDYLAAQQRLDNLTFKPLAKNVLVHMPCSMDKGSIDNMLALLKLIPDIRLLNFEDKLPCCGAGGMQLLTPKQSNRDLLRKKVESMQKSQADFVVSANIGCTLHLLNGLNKYQADTANKQLEVIHPVTLLSRQLNT